MRILVLGQGGREDALRGLLASEGHFCIRRDFRLYPGHVVLFCKENKIDLVVVGPEKFLEIGIVNIITAHHISVFGPRKESAMLETSKLFAKEFCAQYGIPTAKYRECRNLEHLREWISSREGKLVLKESGLAGGKGVLVTDSAEQALGWGKKALKKGPLVLEEFLSGREVSFFVLCDGERVRFLGTAQDYKSAYAGGPNTGGMGAVSPAPHFTEEMKQEVMRSVVHPTMEGLRDRGLIYRGVLYCGLMWTQDGLKVLEYNCRFGDPEFQAMGLLFQDGNFGETLYACASGNLLEASLKVADQHSACVVLADKGYPQFPQKGSILQGLKSLSSDIRIFYSGAIRLTEDSAVNTAGRVLSLASVRNSTAEAVSMVYNEIEKVVYPNGFFRRNIGLE